MHVSSILEKDEILLLCNKRGKSTGRVESVDHQLDSTQTEVARSFHSQY